MRRSALLAVLALIALPASAGATFPGQNGKIAFTTSGGGISVINPDGTGLATPAPGGNFGPAYSSDGQKIAFTSNRDGNAEIYVMNSDGSGQARITNDPRADSQPSWSPDSSRIVFTRDSDIWSMRSAGTDQTALVTGPGYEDSPVWSPGGEEIAYSDQNQTVSLMKPDGTQLFTLDYGLSPSWSPDGREVWAGYDWHDDVEEVDYEYLWVMGIHGGGTPGNYFDPYGHVDEPVVSPDNTQFLTTPQPGYGSGLKITTRGGVSHTLPVDGRDPDWQPLPANTPSAFARPRGATPIYVPLVPAFNECKSPNSTHGAPLAFGSCKPAFLRSSPLTLGTPDANGKAANSLGFVQYVVHTGTPGGADTSDVLISFSLTSVYDRWNSMTDYTGDVQVRTSLQVTDKESGVASTGVDLPLSFTATCAATADPSTGGSCAVQTTADAIRPGLVPEGQRSVWELGKVEVLDSSKTPFVVQGVFIP
jgi:hypothetical protein